MDLQQSVDLVRRRREGDLPGLAGLGLALGLAGLDLALGLAGLGLALGLAGLGLGEERAGEAARDGDLERFRCRASQTESNSRRPIKNTTKTVFTLMVASHMVKCSTSDAVRYRSSNS